MGKYALEQYSPYETYKIRPLSLSKATVNPGRGQYRLVELTWEELEPHRGKYNLNRLKEALAEVHNPVLSIKQVLPAWLKKGQEESFKHLIRRVASVLNNEKLIGVAVSMEDGSQGIWDAYLEAFEGIPLLVSLEQEALLQYLKDHESPFGLIVNCSEDNWISCCEKFAGYRLQNTWQRMPVLLQIEEESPGENIRREGLRWHAGLSNRFMDVGYDFSIRRLTYPKKIASKGALPLRFWFVNGGSAPCYLDYSLRLRLEKGGEQQEFVLNIDKGAWKVGDNTHNEIISLPILPLGEYGLSVGIFFADESPMELDIRMEEKDGYYRLGTVEVCKDTAVDLARAWDDFYPDGYYPLEDPQLPD
ncbi:hypothetical protein [Lacrimispora sphenoides]|uniref:DUF4832 domain-containing protein n=1 Tax=Lacrimispora sphenoides JCM 1415 TaxID=1297793 RepID=A0ABY1C421_9FIRM|nr:hypothetical protein [Lacrimispora sphenoides]SET63052.1 hypothetical protein SAMN02745906_0776 [[Clostridium] sphenoides JCM 1415]SUY50159.1 Uncharacterised protein [Lacrimispora sphenoides]